MKLIKGGGQVRCNCKMCCVEIYSSDWKYKAKKGSYCFSCGRIKSLYSGLVVLAKKRRITMRSIIRWYNREFCHSHVFRWFIYWVAIMGVLGGLIYGISL